MNSFQQNLLLWQKMAVQAAAQFSGPSFGRDAIIMALPSESNGLFEDLNIPIFYSGVGKVNATLTAAQVIASTQCQRIINLGSAGSSKFVTHSLIECSGFVQRDMDLTPLGFKLGVTPLDEISDLIEGTPFTSHLPKGICGSGDSFEVGPSKVPCDLVDMESYALAKVAKKLGVEFISFKYITDGADESAHRDWSANLNSGAIALFDLYKTHLKV